MGLIAWIKLGNLLKKLAAKGGDMPHVKAMVVGIVTLAGGTFLVMLRSKCPDLNLDALPGLLFTAFMSAGAAYLRSDGVAASFGKKE